MNLVSKLASGWRAFAQGGKGFATPDLTKVQTLAVGQAAVAVLLVLGFDLDDDTTQLILGLAAALGVGLPVSDAVVRQGRAKDPKALQAAQASATEQPTLPLPTGAERRRLFELRDYLWRER